MSEQQNEVMVTSSDLAMVDRNLLNEKQLKHLLKRTPSKYIYERPAKGGGKWKFVTGAYVKKILNLMFGWDWDFEVKSHQFDLGIGQAYVLGRLVCRITREDGSVRTIVKEQFGRVDIKFKTVWDKELKKKVPTSEPLDIGNDLKAATTDALKKCASELGVASDIYAPEEFNEVRIVSEGDVAERVASLYEETAELLPPEEQLNIERIIETSETASYKKAIKLMNNYKAKAEQS